jgi:Protein of unknown function (DUF2917)
MDTLSHALTLGQGDILRITDSRGLLVQVARGKVWLTEERDRRDIVLGPDQSYRLERRGLALVYALEPVALSLFTPHRRERAWSLPRLGLVPAAVC